MGYPWCSEYSNSKVHRFTLDQIATREPFPIAVQWLCNVKIHHICLLARFRIFQDSRLPKSWDILIVDCFEPTGGSNAATGDVP